MEIKAFVYLIKKLLILTFIAFCFEVNAENIVDVTEQTIRLAGNQTEILYFGFDEGDEIKFSFKELNNKELGEIEILEYPSFSRFSQFKSKNIENKSLKVTTAQVYVFRFSNTAITARICSIKIQRVPRSIENQNFNSSIKWILKQDTSWNTYTKDVLIGYDSITVFSTKKQLVKVDTLFMPIFDKVLRVHSETELGKSQFTYTDVNLPKNTYYPSSINPYVQKELACWTYWIGVGQKAIEEYDDINKNLTSSIGALANITGYGALANLAITGIAVLKPVNIGDNVNYKFITSQLGQQRVLEYGNVVSAFGRNEIIKQGAFTIELYNDNFKDGIDVSIKIIAMQIEKTWEDVKQEELKITPKFKKEIFSEPKVSTMRIPVISN